MRTRTGVFAVFLAAAVFAACASVPLPEREGVALYRRKCGACHRPYAPAEIRPEKRPKALAEMSQRAKLTPEETVQIRAYLEADFVPSH